MWKEVIESMFTLKLINVKSEKTQGDLNGAEGPWRNEGKG